MSLISRSRRLLEDLPDPVRVPFERTLALLPRQLLYGESFRATRRVLELTERMNPTELARWQATKLATHLAHCHQTVPYYRGLLERVGYRNGVSNPGEILSELPLLTKEMLRSQQQELLSSEIPESRRERVATGGTSGEPLHFWIDRGRSAIEWAFMTWQWGRIGFRLGDRRVVLRGAQLKGADGVFARHQPLLDELTLSTFGLSPQTVSSYAAAIQRFGPSFLHAYASSAEQLARLMRDLQPPTGLGFRGVLLGSENVYPSQVQLLEQEFKCRVFSWYGHSEKCLLGGWCRDTHDYHMFPQYGLLEILREDGSPCEPGERGFLCGTGFMNKAMPFLRYVTDDTGVLVEGPCKCGLPYPRVRDIVGRWHGEILYGTQDRVFTMTALNTHSPVFDSVRQFRLVQDRIGEVTVEVVPGPRFAEADARRIEAEYGERCGHAIRFAVKMVESIPLTERGKFKFVVQHLKSFG